MNQVNPNNSKGKKSKKNKQLEGPGPFSIRDCSLLSISTGLSAHNLRELREGLQRVPAVCIYHHFWGRLLQPRFDEPEYNNDFASWAFRALNDKALAERLSVIDPTDYVEIEDLRQEVLEIVEMRLDESEFVPWARADQQFHFIQSQIVVLDTGRRVNSPEDLVNAIPKISLGSVFYHFIDARRRTEERFDDFSVWLKGYQDKYQDLINSLQRIDPYFSSLYMTRTELLKLFNEYFNGGRS